MAEQEFSEVLWGKLVGLKHRYAELEQAMVDDTIIGTPAYNNILKEHARLSRLMHPFNEMIKLRDDLVGAAELLSDPDMKELAEMEIAEKRDHVLRNFGPSNRPTNSKVTKKSKSPLSQHFFPPGVGFRYLNFLNQNGKQ